MPHLTERDYIAGFRQALAPQHQSNWANNIAPCQRMIPLQAAMKAPPVCFIDDIT